jgi:hypothetical protein
MINGAFDRNVAGLEPPVGVDKPLFAVHPERNVVQSDLTGPGTFSLHSDFNASYLMMITGIAGEQSHPRLLQLGRLIESEYVAIELL